MYTIKYGGIEGRMFIHSVVPQNEDDCGLWEQDSQVKIGQVEKQGTSYQWQIEMRDE